MSKTITAPKPRALKFAPGRSKTHVLPLDLQMIVRTAYAENFPSESLFTEIAGTDAAVLKMLATRGYNHDEDLDGAEIAKRDKSDEYRLAVKALKHYYASGQSQEKFTTPDEAAEEVMSMVEHEVRRTAFAVGLCLGYRLTRSMGGAR